MHMIMYLCDWKGAGKTNQRTRLYEDAPTLSAVIQLFRNPHFRRCALPPSSGFDFDPAAKRLLSRDMFNEFVLCNLKAVMNKIRPAI